MSHDGTSQGRRRFVPDWGSDHLTLDAVVAFVDSELSPGAEERAAEHVASCPQCAAEVVEQRQVRAALRAAAEPSVPSSLMAALRSIPTETELPPALPQGLAMAPDGQMVALLREPPAGLQAGAGPRAEDVPRPAASRSRRLRAGATALSGVALGALALGSLPSAAPVGSPPPVPPERGVLGGAVLGGLGSADPAARFGAPGGAVARPAAVRPTAPPTQEPASIALEAPSVAPTDAKGEAGSTPAVSPGIARAGGPSPQRGFPPAALR